MTLHSFITCDICNEDGIFDNDATESDYPMGVIEADEERAEAHGWQISPGDPHVEHVCPACLELGPGDADEPSP
jgi:hypothetical protein